MKLFTFLALFVISLSTQAQVSLVEYYTKENKKTQKVEEAYYSRSITRNKDKSMSVKDTYLSTDKTKLLGTYKSLKEKTFVREKYESYENGNMKAKEYYSPDGKRIDTALYYYPDGKLKIAFQYPYTIEKKKTKVTDTLILIFKDTLGNTLLTNGKGYAELENPYPGIKNSIEKGNFENHKRTGKWTGSFLNGKYTFTEHYDNGQLLHGTTVDSTGKETKYDPSTFMKKPEYPDGMTNFRTDLTRLFRYPQESIDAKVDGTIRIRYTVDEEGKITNIKVVEDLGYGTGEAAVEALKLASRKNWIPATIRGIPVKVEYTLPLRIAIKTKTTTTTRRF